ncbi:programmed cell death protein 7 [Stegostoma tigrinum]|uniref:programmed cell death protein 7 n=1 Tax=Stegostoma tigrinum TaxID=3053191 RepID=UPI00286FC1FC|nr:programmed cell death protein 7 [Stegostoma tigrinum]
MERPPPFYSGLPERRHEAFVPPPPPTALLLLNRGRDSFYNPGIRNEERPGAAFSPSRQPGLPGPERGLAQGRAAVGGDWRLPAPPAESFQQGGPGGPAPTLSRVEAPQEYGQHPQWDPDHRDRLRNYPPQPWGRDQPPFPQGQQHRDQTPQPQGQQHGNYSQGQQHQDQPPLPKGQQHRDYRPQPRDQQHRDEPPDGKGQQHQAHSPHPQGQYPIHPLHPNSHQHLDYTSHSQKHERLPHPWNHPRQSEPPHLPGCPPVPQHQQQKEHQPHQQGYERRDQVSVPQGFSQQDHSADQYQEIYLRQGLSHRSQLPFQPEQTDSQRYPFWEHLHPEQHTPFSQRAGVANNVLPQIHSMPSQSENISCQDQSMLCGGGFNSAMAYGPQNSQLINPSHGMPNQQNFPNSSGEILSWKNDRDIPYSNENMVAPWSSVANFSQNRKDVNAEQLHRNDSMTRNLLSDQLSHNFKYNEPLKEQDELWLTRFLSNRRLQPCEIKKPRSYPSVSEVKESVLSACKLVTELTTLCQLLRYNVENEAVWTESYLKAVEMRTALQEKIKTLKDDNYLSAVKRKLERIKKKRSSIQRKKQMRRLEKQEEEARTAEKEAKIDEWRMKCIREVEEKKRERELKAAADGVLSEVRKKQADAKRLTDILRALEKLRKLRKEAAARKGVHPPPSADETFERHIERLRKLIKKRSDLYDAEERALRVMLEGEQEEERKRENEKKLKKEREKLEKQQREVEMMMFGDPDLPSDHPLQPFRQYYLQAEHSSHALVQIRQEWDRYLVSGDHPDGSSIPQGWVFPHPPTSDTWATALKQNES